MGTSSNLRALVTLALAVCCAGEVARAASAYTDGGLRAPMRTNLPHLDDVLGALTLASLGEEGSLAGAQEQLEELGPGVVPTLFALATGSAPVPDAILDQGPLMTRQHESLIAEALRAWDPERVVRQLTELTSGRCSVEERLTAAGMLGELESAAAVEGLLELTEGFDETALLHPRVFERVAASLARLLQGDEASWLVLPSALNGCGDVTQTLIVDAVGRTGSSRGLGVLEDLLDETPELDVRILGALGNLDAAHLVHAAPTVRELARRFLSARDPDARREAWLTLARVCDEPSVPIAVQLLADEDPGPLAAILEFLRVTSGKKWEADPDRWAAWLATENRWRTKDAGRLFDELSRAAPARAVGILRELAHHPLYRTEIAYEVGGALARQEPQIVTFACRTLSRLGDRGAVSDLIAALGDARPEVVVAAHAALRALTGAELPADRGAWSDWLDG